jgi:ribosomal protein S4
MLTGTQMQYAGYLLNPGDMFQVDVDRVLYATGAPKTIEQIRTGRKLLKAQSRVKKGPAPPKARAVAKAASTTPAAGLIRTEADIQEVRKQRKLDFKELLVQVEDIMEDKRRRVGAKRKIAIRAFARDVRKAMSTVNRKNEKELDDQLAGLISKLAIAKNSPADAAAESESQAAPAGPSVEEQRQFREAITRARENPIDESKPYATPWQPRPYMSVFAFIPRYLEVNHNICSAVYLRHPVARRGQSEVPSPFPEVHQQLAFNWYLRRR